MIDVPNRSKATGRLPSELPPLVDREGEVRELTAEDFKHFRPTREMMPDLFAVSERKQKLPTLEDVGKGLVTLDEYEIAHGEDAPEWSEADFANARPVSEFPELAELLAASAKRPVLPPIPVDVSPPVAVRFTDKTLHIVLADGRELAMPLTWYPDLLGATPEQRSLFVLQPGAVAWPQLEEKADIADILRTQLKLAALRAEKEQQGK